MDINEFILKICDFLNFNKILYNIKNVGHIIKYNMDDNTYCTFDTKDIIIELCENKCFINIQFNLIDNIYYLKEMTISIVDKNYGYKHCKLYNKESPNLDHFKLNTELNETNLESLLNYLKGLLPYKNSYSMLEAIWAKSVTRSAYKKKYPLFTLDNIKLVNSDYIKGLIDKYDVFNVEYGQKFFYN